MENKKKHLQTLVYFARIDSRFDAEEKDFIRQIGRRLELEDEEISIILDTNPSEGTDIPDNQVLRFILFDDLMNLIAVDRKVSDEEEQEVKRIAGLLGFDPGMADGLLARLKRHIELGFDANQLSHSIKNSVFSLTNKMMSDEKYSL